MHTGGRILNLKTTYWLMVVTCWCCCRGREVPAVHGAGGGGRGTSDGVPLFLPPLQLRPHPRAGRAVRVVGLAGRPHGHQDVTSTTKLHLYLK